MTPIPPGPIGSGGFLQLHSDFVGPFAPGSEWRFDLTLDPEGTKQVAHLEAIPATTNDFTLLMPGLTGQQWQLERYNVADGATIYVQAQIHDSGGFTIDSGTSSWTWATGMDQLVAQTRGQETGTGGLTAEQSVQLQTAAEGVTVDMSQVGQTVTSTIGALLQPFRIDFSPSISLSGGVTCDPVRVNLSGAAFYGIKVHVITIPDEWRFGTPDGDWGFHDLAVLSCWINDDQLVRCGIHTPSFVLTPLPGTAVPFISTAIAELQPPGYAVHVDWAPGVCGEVLGINLPVLR